MCFSGPTTAQNVRKTLNFDNICLCLAFGRRNAPPNKATHEKIMKGKLLVIDACVREKDSRTLRIATPIVEELKGRYDVLEMHLPQMQMDYLDPKMFAQRGEGDVPNWAELAARRVAEADRIVIVTPFWDMSFPAALKVFVENVSLDGVTFKNDGKTCVGLCKCKKVLYITTRGMEIPDGDPREQGSPYIKALSTLWGLGEVTMLSAWNMDYCSPKELEKKISDATRKGLAIAEDF